MLLGYARVSKADDQDAAAQVSALKAAGCTRVYEEKASGGRWDRPELHRMLDHLREGDVVVVWKLDRLSRSLKDLLHILEKTEAAGQGSRMGLAGDDPEHVVVVPGGLLAPTAKAGLTAAIAGDEVEGDFA
jgi:DNA invertase Pin-like site-specific DNA recombinase